MFHAALNAEHFAGQAPTAAHVFSLQFHQGTCSVLLTMYVLLALLCLFQACDDSHIFNVPHTGSDADTLV